MNYNYKSIVNYEEHEQVEYTEHYRWCFALLRNHWSVQIGINCYAFYFEKEEDKLLFDLTWK